MLNFEEDILSIQQLEYEMDRDDLPDDYNFLKYDIVVTLPSLTHILNSRNPLY